MVKKILCVCLSILFMLCHISAMASGELTPESAPFSDISIKYERESAKVTIKGKAPLCVNFDEPVRLLVLQPDDESGVTNFDKLVSGEKTLESIGVHIAETMLNEDKSFEFPSFKMKENLPAGEYNVIIFAEDDVYTATYYAATVSQTIDALNSAKTADEVSLNIEKYNDVYKLQMDEKSDYVKLSDGAKINVLENLCGKNFETTEEISDAFNLYVQLARIKEGPWGVIEEIIEKHYSILGISDKKEEFDDLSSSKKDMIYKALVGGNYDDKDEFVSAFSDALKDAKKETTSKPSGGGSSSSKGQSTSAQISYPTQTNAPADEKEDDVNVEEEAYPFADVENYQWAKESILTLYEKGIINGKSDNVFAPGDKVTRAEVVKMIILALGIDGNKECDFSDVAKDSWMYPYVSVASDKGIVLGYDDGTFGADSYITREDLAVIIVRAINASEKELKNVKDNGYFADENEISNYAKDAVEALFKAGIINGAGDNMFMPKNNATRAEVAKVIASITD